MISDLCPSTRQGKIALCLYLAIIGLHCAWVLSLPVFPSQDGPLHLYYVSVFRDLLRHGHGNYSSTYFIGRYLPPYSTYYYGLIALGTVCSLEHADKLIVCISFVVLGLGVRRLMQSINPVAVWAPFLILPVLLNWPLMMGFVNYVLAAGLSCFALALWCVGRECSGIAPRIVFFLVLTAVLLTHPVPWMFVILFILFDVAWRACTHGSRGVTGAGKSTPLQLDALTAAVSLVGVPYLLSFRNLSGQAIHAVPPEGPFFHALAARLADYRHLYGMVLFVDGSTSSHLHRVLLAPLVLLLVGFALAGLRGIRSGSVGSIWILFSLAFLLVFPLVPANLNNSYFFAMRLMFLVYLCLAVAASGSMGGRVAPVVAGTFAAFSLFTLALAQRRVAPVAHEIAALQGAPAVLTDRPGLLVWPQAGTTGALSWNPLLWAGAGYARQHHDVLYNTTWLELAIIPVKVKPAALTRLDPTFSVLPPQVVPERGTLFLTPEMQAETLGRVGLAIGVHAPGATGADILSGDPTSTAGWHCTQTGDWQVCTPSSLDMH